MFLSICLLVALLPKPEVRVVKDDRPKWSAEAHYFHFNEQTPLAQLADRVLVKDARDSLREFIVQAKESLKEFPDSASGYYFAMDPKLEVHRKDLISVSASIDTFMGGAHGSQAFSTHAFGFIRGHARELRLSDLFRPGVKPAAVLSPLIIGKLKKREGADWVQEGRIKSFSNVDLSQFVVTAEGLSFLFPPYAVGPYSSGPFEVPVAFSEIRSSLDSAGPLKGLLKR